MKWITVFMLLLLLASCRSVRIVPVEKIVTKTDTIHDVREVYIEREDTRKDSVRESTTEKVTVTVNEKGDTVRTDREVVFIRDRLLEIENILLKAENDSLKIATHQTEYVKETVEVERNFTAWERFRLKSWWWIVGAVFLLGAFSFRRPIRKFIGQYIRRD